MYLDQTFQSEPVPQLRNAMISASLHGGHMKHFFVNTKKSPGDQVQNRSAIFRAEAHLKQLETFNRFFLEIISHLAQQSKNTSLYITQVVGVACMSEDDLNWCLRHPLQQPNTGQPHKSHSKSSNASNETASKADPSTCWKRIHSMEQYLPMQIPAAHDLQPLPVHNSILHIIFIPHHLHSTSSSFLIIFIPHHFHPSSSSFLIIFIPHHFHPSSSSFLIIFIPHHLHSSSSSSSSSSSRSSSRSLWLWVSQNVTAFPGRRSCMIDTCDAANADNTWPWDALSNFMVAQDNCCDELLLLPLSFWTIKMFFLGLTAVLTDWCTKTLICCK